MKHVGYFSTLNRVLEVGSHKLAKMHMPELKQRYENLVEMK